MTKLKSGLLICVLAASVALTGCASKTGSLGGNPNEKVATVNDNVITRQEYNQVYDQLAKAMHIDTNDKDVQKNDMVQEALKRMVLNKLILNELVQADAKKLNVTVTDQEVDKFTKEQMKQAGGEEMLKKFLASNNMSDEEFKNAVREQLLLNKFLEKKGGASLKVSEQEAKDYYNSHPTEFDTPETIRASHILVKAIEPELRKEIRDKNPKISDDELDKKVTERKNELKAKAQNLFNQVQMNPSKLPELAKQSSDDVISARNGGDLGYMAQQTLEPTFWTAIKQTKPGTLYPKVLETRFGYHVIQVKDHAKAHRQTFAEARGAIEAMLANQKKQQLLEKWVAEQKRDAKIQIEPAFAPKEPAPVTSGAPTVMPQGAAASAGPTDARKHGG